MTKPKWIIQNELIYQSLKLDRLPFKCDSSIKSFVGKKGWIFEVNFLISVYDRDNGLPSVIKQDIFLVNKEILTPTKILNSLLEIMNHELRECIQIESNGIRSIPLDPHI